MAGLGPDAYPAPPLEEFADLLDQPRHLHPLLRDQRTIAGIGRSWVDELLWTARLSPFQKGADLEPSEIEALTPPATRSLGAALEHYEEVIGDTVPDKLPMPLQVHRPRRRGPPTLRSAHRGDPLQGLRDVLLPGGADGRPGPKDRRLSRLLK